MKTKKSLYSSELIIESDHENRLDRLKKRINIFKSNLKESISPEELLESKNSKIIWSKNEKDTD